MTMIGVFCIEDKCIRCGACVSSCPFNALEINGEGFPVVLEGCTLCGTCVQACNYDALEMKGKKSEKGAGEGESRGVYTFAEQKGGKVTRVALEMLSPGRKLADLSSTFLCALLIGGEGIEKEAQKLIDHGADKVWVVSHPSLEHFLDEAYAEAIRLLFLQERPAIFLGGATAQGRALFPRVSTLLGTGLTADCTELGIETETGNLLQTRPAFGGNIMATILTPHHRPQMATIRPRVMPLPQPRNENNGEILSFPFDPSLWCHKKRVLESVEAQEEGIPLQDAEVIVSVGRGASDPACLELASRLAQKLGGALGASRAVVDSGLIPYRHQVGQTGITVAPKLYIACGISGALQHQVGMRSSDRIVAINNDPHAPIFDLADVSLVGDAKEVLERLLQGL
ncbi:MAG TPA: electron transfer flavoprotein subunit alpha [Candidatus Aminicenantes bacterium]|nr:electron transfer flavoprotein subunit alpha [Candidatus Aminicenantes bacterium]